MKKVFPEGTISVTYRTGKCLKELISPSLYPRTVTESASRVSKCNKSRCDICKNYMVFKNEFTCTATGKTYKVRGDLTCKSDNVVYLISCKKCKQQYEPCISTNKSLNSSLIVGLLALNCDKGSS